MEDLNLIDLYWFYDPDFGFAPDFDEAQEISLGNSEVFEFVEFEDFL